MLPCPRRFNSSCACRSCAITREEAARRLDVTLAELVEANSFALVTFADHDPELPPRRSSEAERAELRERMPNRMAERQRKAEIDAEG